MGNNAYKQQHKKQGLCVNCPKKAIPGQTRCPDCTVGHRKAAKKWEDRTQYHQKRAKEVREEMIKTHRCPKCHAPLGEQDEGRKQCVNCRTGLHRPKGQPYYGGIDGI